MITFLPRNLSVLSAVIARGETARYTMACVNLLLREDGWYRIEATDGRRLAVVQGPSTPPTVGAKLIEQLLEDAPNSAGSVLIKGSDWKEAFTLCKKGQPVGVKAGQKVVTFAGPGATRVCEPEEGRFPNVASIISDCNKAGAAPLAAGVAFNPENVIPILELAKALEMRVELMGFRRAKGDGESPMGLRGRNDQGQLLDCLVMPLTRQKESAA